MSTLTQTVLPSQSQSIPVIRYQRRHAGDAVERLVDATPPATVVGLSIQQDKDRVVAFALATPTTIVIISSLDPLAVIPKDHTFARFVSGAKDQALLVGFSMPRLAVHLQGALKMHVRGADLSTVVAKSALEPMYPSEVFKKVGMPVDKFGVDSAWHESNGDDESGRSRKLCLQAWLSAIIGTRLVEQLNIANKVDTRRCKPVVLDVLRRLLSQTDAIERIKPKEVVNEFTSAAFADGRITLSNSRYKNRVRVSSQAQVILTTESGQQFTGMAKSVRGKTTTVKVNERNIGAIATVRVIGREQRSNAEKAREEMILLVLQGEIHLPHSPFISAIWFPDRSSSTPALKTNTVNSPLPTSIALNDSQVQAVSTMISEDPPITIVHGPPGTGKTSTICASAQILEQRRSPMWIVAHSNVAVKNIAEKMTRYAISFKIIVSKEFYVEWHEHLYDDRVSENLFRADELPEKPQELRRALAGSNIILTTLGMLSNPAFDDLFNIVPVERLVVDEASQINVMEYMHLLWKFRMTLKKLCFFGDPQQLPPYGFDNDRTLQSIFEINHLAAESYLLNIQYRMPIPLGKFISNTVYAGRLSSYHQISSSSCMSFIEACGSEAMTGLSRVNERECGVVMNLVRYYYGKLDFCIITPYDAQRSLIERELKRNNLPWEKVYNIDSFQGNEADYVIVSLVRTDSVGFLQSTSRMNVMLTRCRRGLIVVTNRNFLSPGGPGQFTLVSKLMRHWETRREDWVEWRAVADQSAFLPGVVGKQSRPPPSIRGNVYPTTTWPPVSLSQNSQRARSFDTKKLFAANRPAWQAQVPIPRPVMTRPSYHVAPLVPQRHTRIQVTDVVRPLKVQPNIPHQLVTAITLDAEGWSKVSVTKGRRSKGTSIFSTGSVITPPAYNRYSILRRRNI